MICDNSLTGTSNAVDDKSLNSSVLYSLDFNWLAWNMLPKVYRNNETFAFIYCIYSEIETFFNLFKKYRVKSIQQSRVNSTTIVFQKYLRDLYNNCAITIINNYNVADKLYLFNQDESEGQTDVNKVYLYNKDENNSNNFYVYNQTESSLGFDFEVNIPIEIIESGVNINEIKSIIKKYSPLSTRFGINII